MLSSSRVIGHKEYGNTPPGGWKGRKTDPVYSMDDRRRQVAGFVPKGARGVSKQEVLDGLAEYFRVDGATYHAWQEDTLRRVQSMHIGGWLSVGDDKNPASIAPRPWHQGGDLAFLDRRSEGMLDKIKGFFGEAKPTTEVKVDAAAVAGVLAKDAGFVGALAKAIVAENDRVARDGDPKTGPVT